MGSALGAEGILPLGLNALLLAKDPYSGVATGKQSGSAQLNRLYDMRKTAAPLLLTMVSTALSGGKSPLRDP